MTMIGVVIWYGVTGALLEARVRTYADGTAILEETRSLAAAEAAAHAAAEDRVWDERDVCALALHGGTIPLDHCVWCDDAIGAPLLAAEQPAPPPPPAPAMHCATCGADLFIVVHFCPNCGAPLSV